MNTNELISSLSAEAPRPRLKSPDYYAVRVIGILILYTLGAQFVLGFRPDIAAQLANPPFLIEVLLLALLSALSSWAAVSSMYPDRLQNSWLFNMPYIVLGTIVAFVVFQISITQQEIITFADVNAHGMECAICIASASILPSALLFGLLRKGASIHPLRSGSFALLAASGIGCLTLRLAEPNDSLFHFAVWHYFPTLLFAALGAWIGRLLLKW